MQKLKKQLSTFNFQLSTCLASQGGMTLVFSVIIISNILLIAFAIGLFGMSQLQIAISIKDSSYAIFGATTGTERALDVVRNDIIIAGSTTCDTGTEAAQVSLFSDTLGNSSQYNASCYIKAVPLIDCDSGQRLMIISNGIYKQTTRKIEANFCR